MFTPSNLRVLLVATDDFFYDFVQGGSLRRGDPQGRPLPCLENVTSWACQTVPASYRRASTILSAN
jgi:hypothetical protein